MSWLKQLIPTFIKSDTADKKGVPEGLWSKCPFCAEIRYRKELERNLEVCPKCNHHGRLGARARLLQVLDENEPVEIGEGLVAVDRLKFKDSKKYKDRLQAAQKVTGEKDALVVMSGQLHGKDVVACAFNFKFLGGSMGAVVGEKFVQGVNTALDKRCPYICFSASGGARMQEGLFSLMQMAKTSAALARLDEKGLPYISVLTDPTMGGVSASLSMLGDIIIAEPNALIGFAGPRVIEQTVRQTLPEGFQRSEFLLEHGHIDMVVDRRELKDTLHRILSRLKIQNKLRV